MEQNQFNEKISNLKKKVDVASAEIEKLEAEVSENELDENTIAGEFNENIEELAKELEEDLDKIEIGD